MLWWRSNTRTARIIDELTVEADMVLVDTPAMLPVGDTSATAPKVDGLIFLADMHVVKKPQLMTAADQLMRLPVRMLGTIVRGAGTSGRYSSSYHRYGYSHLNRTCGSPCRDLRGSPQPCSTCQGQGGVRITTRVSSPHMSIAGVSE